MDDRKSIIVQTIHAAWLRPQNISLHVLRLDEWHAVVSGNKWFKLKYYLLEAVAKKHHTVATFGGAYSNHIVATAFACKEMGLKSIGIIRGEKPEIFSHTLLAAEDFEMQLKFVNREEYKNEEAIKATFEDVYWINEGGYGSLGATGAADIMCLVENLENYTHIACAVGTGTTLAGLIKSALPHQTVIGFSALKNNRSLADDVNNLLLDEEKEKPFSILHDYHFGGYAKHTPALLDFMNETGRQHRLPLDFVYTGKAFYGLQNIILNQEIIGAGSRILFIHTGGLQGNLSLPEKALHYRFI